MNDDAISCKTYFYSNKPALKALRSRIQFPAYYSDCILIRETWRWNDSEFVNLPVYIPLYYFRQ